MLKIYLVTNYVSIDGSDWREVGLGGYLASDEKPPDAIVDHWSFDELREYLDENHLSGVYNDNTFFKNKPVVRVKYTTALETVKYKHFDTLSYKRTFAEMKDVTMDFLMKQLSADECIQYLKERGMTACPIMK